MTATAVLGAPQGRLETFAGTAANPVPETVATREGRYAARAIMRGLSHRERVQVCGAKAVQEGGVALRVAVGPDGVSAGFKGLSTCGSPWVCPVCSAKVAAVRMRELTEAVEAHTRDGGRLALLTVTMRHRKGQRLKRLWDGMSGSWRHFVSGGSYKRLIKRLGVTGYVRATEVTHGANGWHVHFHVLYFLGPDTLTGDDSVAATRNALVALWLEAVEAQGFSALSKGQDFRVFYGAGEALRAGAEYLVKTTYTPASVGGEVAGGAYKGARMGGRTPFGIAAGIVDAIEADGVMPDGDLALWEEWDKASTGRRQMVWSRGLRDRLGLDAPLTDDEAAALVLAGTEVLMIPPRWVRFVFSGGRLPAWILAAAETGSCLDTARAAAGAVLTDHGIPWSACAVDRNLTAAA